jgi:anti-anti-sigma factor
MNEFLHIAASPWECGEKQVLVIEILEGRLWGPTVMQELVQELTSLLEQIEHKHILLNMGKVDYISSAALNRLINFQKRVREAGGELKLCNLRPPVDEIFHTTRFNQVVEIQPTEAEALASNWPPVVPSP